MSFDTAFISILSPTMELAANTVWTCTMVHRFVCAESNNDVLQHAGLGVVAV